MWGAPGSILAPVPWECWAVPTHNGELDLALAGGCVTCIPTPCGTGLVTCSGVPAAGSWVHLVPELVCCSPTVVASGWWPLGCWWGSECHVKTAALWAVHWAHLIPLPFPAPTGLLGLW